MKRQHGLAVFKGDPGGVRKLALAPAGVKGIPGIE